MNNKTVPSFLIVHILNISRRIVLNEQENLARISGWCDLSSLPDELYLEKMVNTALVPWHHGLIYWLVNPTGVS